MITVGETMARDAADQLDGLNQRHAPPGSLPELVRMLGALKLEERELSARIHLVEEAIYRRAVDELHVVAKPRLNATSQFRCAGKIVELHLSTFGNRAVQLVEVESLPSAD